MKDTARVNNMLRQVKGVFPRNLKLAWTVKPRGEQGGPEILELVALKASRDNKAALGGEVIVDARQDYDQNGKVEVTIQMNSEGAKAGNASQVKTLANRWPSSLMTMCILSPLSTTKFQTDVRASRVAK